ncbi:MAG: hypothetical protein AAB819_03310 [Patescibacteria group bacterium]
MLSGIQKKTRVILLASFVAFLIASGAYGGIVYLFLKQKNEVAAMPLTATELFRKVEEAQAAKHFLSATVAERTALRTFFFRDDDIVRFLGDVESAARQVGASLTLTSADADKEDGLGIEAGISGQWESVARFLALIETYPAPIEIIRVSLNAVGSAEKGSVSEREWSGTIMFTLKSYIKS